MNEDLTSSTLAASDVSAELGRSLGATLTWKPYGFVQLLPRCDACGGKHPHAYSPHQPSDTCPDCGGPASAMGPLVEVTADLMEV